MSYPLIEIRDRIISEEGTAADKDNEYRREIQDLFRDYRHPWDILSELIQNSVDAINANNNIQVGRIEITIRPTDRVLQIKDNGIGIEPEKIQKVLVPNVSIDKSSSTTYGYKGVGLSFVSHLTKRFEITSFKNGKKINYILENSIDWVVGRSGVTPSQVLSNIENTTEDNGTSISLTLNGSYSDTGHRTLQSLDYFFDWAKNKKTLEYVLRTKTAIGSTCRYFGRSVKTLEVQINVPGSPTSNIEDKYLSPFDSAYASRSRYNLQSTLGRTSTYESIFLDSTRRDSEKTFRCLRHDVFDIEVGTRIKTKFGLSILVCGETGVTEIEREYGIESLDESIRYSFRSGTGVFLSISGMPTGIKLHEFKGGFNQRFMCLVDVGMDTNAELDKGRKGISEHTKNLIIKKIDDILGDRRLINNRYSLRQAAHKMKETTTRGYGGADTKSHIDKWDAMPDYINEFLIKKEPLDENGVIIIFTQLIGLDKLKRYEFKYISQDATYDFAFNYYYNTERLDEPQNPFSLSKGFVDNLSPEMVDSSNIIKGQRGIDWHTGEFKIDAQDIIGKEDQPLNQLDLIIVWDYNEDEIVNKGGNIRQVTSDIRKYEGGTHILSDDIGDCQMICLKEVLKEFGYIDSQ